MTTRILILLIVISFPSCLTMDTKCCDFIDSYSIPNSLYVEKYRTFCAGVFGETIDCYLTDSTSFRQLIGSYDEHQSLKVKQDGNKMEVYNLESSSIPDTLEKRTISKAELFAKHFSDSSCLTAIPIFGKNTITCDSDYYPASSYKTDDGYYMTEVQYKCGNDYLNAAYYTDSLKFRVFIGVYSPGSFSNNYSVKLNSNNNFDFFNIEYKNKVDTIKHETYLLTKLKKRGMVKVCR